MTTRLPADHYRSLHERPHAAILVTVEQSLSREDGLAVVEAVEAYLEATGDVEDMRPLWIKFEDFETVRAHSLMPFFSPADRTFLGELIKAIPAVDKFNLVSEFDFEARQYPKRKAAVPEVAKMPTRRSASTVEEYVNEWPLKLRFLATEEARREAHKLGSIYERWPFVNFTAADLKETSDRRVRDFEERYPLLARADRLMSNKITRVISALGRHPHAPVWERKRFWGTVKLGGVMQWETFADDLLAEIEAGRTDRFRLHDRHEEEPETAAEKIILRDVARTGGKANRARPHCPPSVPKSLWRRVPDDRKQEAIEYAAKKLIRGIHPEDAFEEFVSSIALR